MLETIAYGFNIGIGIILSLLAVLCLYALLEVTVFYILPPIIRFFIKTNDRFKNLKRKIDINQQRDITD